MSVSLATTWNPRGELSRLQRLYPLLEQVYDAIVVVFPPVADPEQVREFKMNVFFDRPNLLVVHPPDWGWGRYVALQKAAETRAGHIHYADMDRLLRWVETRPQELRHTVEMIQGSDCLVIGRTAAAYATHPRALMRTEATSNRVISHLLGQQVDVSAGSKGFSLRAARYLVANSQPGHALGTDAEWPLLLQRAGFRIDYVEVDGLDWESADRYQEQAANVQSQRQAAQAYDADPENWASRVEVAMEIINTGINVVERKYTTGIMERRDD